MNADVRGLYWHAVWYNVTDYSELLSHSVILEEILNVLELYRFVNPAPGGHQQHR